MGVNLGGQFAPRADRPRELAVPQCPHCPMPSLGWEGQSSGLAGELPSLVTSTGPTLSPGRPLLRAGQPPRRISGHTDGQGVGMKGRPDGWYGSPTPTRPGSCQSAFGGGRLSGGTPCSPALPSRGQLRPGLRGQGCRGGWRALRQWDHFYKTEHMCLPPGWVRGEHALLHACSLVGSPQSPTLLPAAPPYLYIRTHLSYVS